MLSNRYIVVQNYFYMFTYADINNEAKEIK